MDKRKPPAATVDSAPTQRLSDYISGIPDWETLYEAIGVSDRTWRTHVAENSFQQGQIAKICQVVGLRGRVETFPGRTRLEGSEAEQEIQVLQVGNHQFLIKCFKSKRSRCDGNADPIMTQFDAALSTVGDAEAKLLDAFKYLDHRHFIAAFACRDTLNLLKPGRAVKFRQHILQGLWNGTAVAIFYPSPNCLKKWKVDKTPFLQIQAEFQKLRTQVAAIQTQGGVDSQTATAVASQRLQIFELEYSEMPSLQDYVTCNLVSAQCGDNDIETVGFCRSPIDDMRLQPLPRRHPVLAVLTNFLLKWLPNRSHTRRKRRNPTDILCDTILARLGVGIEPPDAIPSSSQTVED